MKEQGFPMISAGLEKTGLNIAGGAVELISVIPPNVWAVIIGYAFLRLGISKLRSEKKA